MVVFCVVCGKVKTATNKRVSFHYFPKDPDDRSKWLKFCGLEEKDLIASSSKVCSEHFLVEDFVANKTEGPYLYLKKGRIPSIRRKKSYKGLVSVVPFSKLSIPHETTSNQYIIESGFKNPQKYEDVQDEHQSSYETPAPYFQPITSNELIVDIKTELNTSSEDLDESGMSSSWTESISICENNLEFSPQKYEEVESSALHQSTCETTELIAESSIKKEHCASSESLQSSWSESISISENNLESTSQKHEVADSGQVVNQTSTSRYSVPRYVGDINSFHLETPQRARASLNRAKAKIEGQRRQIISLQQENKKLLKKTKILEGLVRQLKEQMFKGCS